MKWFQHSTDSHDDPDISDAMDEFGPSGYSSFFILLELYGREFNSIDSDGFLNLSLRFVARKLRQSSPKVQQILNFYLKNQRVISKIDGNRVLLCIPQYLEIASNWTKRTKPTPTEILGSGSVETTAKEEEEKKKKKTTIENHFSPTSIEYELSKRLLDHIKHRHPEFKEPILQNWAKEINLMIRYDKRPCEQIRHVIDWCQDNEFWQNNILSVKKLRKQYDQLILKMGKKQSSDFDTDNYLRGLENESKRINDITK